MAGAWDLRRVWGFPENLNPNLHPRFKHGPTCTCPPNLAGCGPHHQTLQRQYPPTSHKSNILITLCPLKNPSPKTTCPLKLARCAPQRQACPSLPPSHQSKLPVAQYLCSSNAPSHPTILSFEAGQVLPTPANLAAPTTPTPHHTTSSSPSAPQTIPLSNPHVLLRWPGVPDGRPLLLTPSPPPPPTFTPPPPPPHTLPLPTHICLPKLSSAPPCLSPPPPHTHTCPPKLAICLPQLLYGSTWAARIAVRPKPPAQHK